MQNYFQIEDLLQILNIIKLNFPLKKTRGWAASPDYIKVLYREILKKLKDKENILIVECGSGVSTIVCSYLLDKYSPSSRIYSLDHNIDYAKETAKELNYHKLSNIAKVIYAPLKKYKIIDNIWFWYETEKILNEICDKKIDILIVDGPPMSVQKNSRYPVIPILKEYIDLNTTIILDDANRIDEKEIVKKWKKELIFFKEEFLDTEKGTSILEIKNYSYKPLISICIPTYNRKEFLIEAIESAINQIYPNIEIIIVDDGSEIDIKKEVIELFNNKKIRYYKNDENMGRPYTRNRCVKEAKGEYILWLDDDDKLDFETISYYIEILNNYEKVDVIYGKLQVLDENRLFIDPIDFYKNSAQLANSLITQGCVIPNPATLVKKDIYEKFGLYDEMFYRAQDYEFWSRIALDCNFKKCDKIVAKYRIHDNNISTGKIYNFDTSFESVIKRKLLQKNNYKKIFYYLDSVYDIKKELSFSLMRDLDMFNAIYYCFDEAISKKDEEEISKKIIYSLKMNKIDLANYLIDFVDDKNIKDIVDKYQKIVKKIEKLYKREKNKEISEYLNILTTLLNDNWISFYINSLINREKNQKLSKKYARASLIMNPFSEESENLMINLGYKNQEIKNIKNRLIENVNFLEENKKDFIKKFF